MRTQTYQIVSEPLQKGLYDLCDAYGIAMRRQRYERVHRPRSEDGDDRIPDLEDAK